MNRENYNKIAYDMLKNHKKPIKRIALFEGRPKRETMINNEDIINLKIAIETSKNFEDFLNNT
jgi:hypothetical protein